jgi:hypothetical protein
MGSEPLLAISRRLERSLDFQAKADMRLSWWSLALRSKRAASAGAPSRNVAPTARAFSWAGRFVLFRKFW